MSARSCACLPAFACALCGVMNHKRPIFYGFWAFSWVVSVRTYRLSGTLNKKIMAKTWKIAHLQAALRLKMKQTTLSHKFILETLKIDKIKKHQLLLSRSIMLQCWSWQSRHNNYGESGPKFSPEKSSVTIPHHWNSTWQSSAMVFQVCLKSERVISVDCRLCAMISWMTGVLGILRHGNRGENGLNAEAFHFCFRSKCSKAKFSCMHVPFTDRCSERSGRRKKRAVLIWTSAGSIMWPWVWGGGLSAPNR